MITVGEELWVSKLVLIYLMLWAWAIVLYHAMNLREERCYGNKKKGNSSAFNTNDPFYLGRLTRGEMRCRLKKSHL